MRNEAELASVLDAIRKAEDVLLICHVSPDGDTLGSALALYARLRRMGKRAQIGVDGDVPQIYKYLPEQENVKKPEECLPAALALSIDVSDTKRLGGMKELFDACGSQALIDHHPTNDGFAQINTIDGDAPASAVLAWRLMKLEGMPISPEEALCLYTGLSTDTGNFVYESTNAESFTMMGELMQCGLDLDTYSRLLFRRKSRIFVRLLELALPSLKVSEDGEIAGLVVTAEQLKAAGATAEHTDGLVDYAIDLEGVKAAYFMREEPDGKIKASLRAIKPVRIDKLAQSLGGGGHWRAAGCSLYAPMDEARTVIERGLREAVDEAVE